jgi:hypothetical protein
MRFRIEIEMDDYGIDIESLKESLELYFALIHHADSIKIEEIANEI